MSSDWLAVALCCLVLLAGCQGPSQVLGGADAEQATPSDAVTSTPSPTPTVSPTETASPTPTSTASTGSFDTTRFRQEFVSVIDRARETRGFQPLAADTDRRHVADRIARDLADASYFRNTTAQNDSRFSVTTRLSRRGLNCTTDRTGSAFYLKGYYRTYTNTSSGIVYYSTEGELARGMTTRLLDGQTGTSRAKLAATVFSPEVTTHAVGVHRTADDVVYVVYVVCAV